MPISAPGWLVKTSGVRSEYVSSAGTHWLTSVYLGGRYPPGRYPTSLRSGSLSGMSATAVCSFEQFLCIHPFSPSSTSVHVGTVIMLSGKERVNLIIVYILLISECRGCFWTSGTRLNSFCALYLPPWSQTPAHFYLACLSFTFGKIYMAIELWLLLSIQVYLVLLHLALLHFTGVAFFTTWRQDLLSAKDLLYCDTLLSVYNTWNQTCSISKVCLYLIWIATNNILDSSFLFLYFKITTVSFCVDFLSRDHFGNH